MKRQFESFPTLAELIAIHEELIKIFDGAKGMRDQGALESALMRPQLGYYEGIIEQTAALMESLAMNHPFVDGNKRVAFFATDIFLRMNGSYIDCDNKKAYEFFMKLFKENNFKFHELKIWLENNTASL